MAKVITVLAQGFEEIEAITIIDILRRGGITVFVVGLDALDVQGAHGITVKADHLLENFAEPFDGIVLPGGQPGAANLAASERVIALVKQTHERQGLCAAICAAPAVLGKAGILLGKRATCFPGCESALLGALLDTSAVVRDGNIITSRGVGTALSFALELVDYLANQRKASAVRSSILFEG